MPDPTLFQESRDMPSNSTSTRPLIRHLGPHESIEGAFSIQNTQLGHARNGNPYIKCMIGDRTGRAPARMWNVSEGLFRSLPTDGFVYVEAQTELYQGNLQIIIRQIHTHEPTQQELLDLLPSSNNDPDEMFGELLRLLKTIDHPALACLRDRYLEDGELMERFCRAPAAQSLHHAYLGGLLEHTLSLVRLADRLLPLYPQLNRDVVLMGLFIHDLGKCAELQWERGFGYTHEGELIGHIARGSLWLEDKARACEDADLGDAACRIPTPILNVLHHIILSHHGKAEFGALKIPATPEALFVSLVDNLDAKLNMALTATRGDDADGSGEDGNGDAGAAGGSDFTQRLWALDNAKFYRPDPTTVQE